MATHPNVMSDVAMFVATVIVALLAFQAGLRFGRWRSQQPNPEPLLAARTLVMSILHLLAFILGFVFGLSKSHFDWRRRAIFDESNAIGSAYHRADFLPIPNGRLCSVSFFNTSTAGSRSVDLERLTTRASCD